MSPSANNLQLRCSPHSHRTGERQCRGLRWGDQWGHSGSREGATQRCRALALPPGHLLPLRNVHQMQVWHFIIWHHNNKKGSQYSQIF